MGDDIAQDLAEVIDDFCKQSAHFAFDSAKECYKELHSGGCRMLTEGDNCQCFLCRIDNYKKIISEA